MPALSHNPFKIRELHPKIFTLCQICVHPSDRLQLVDGPHFVVRHKVCVSHRGRNVAVTKELFYCHDINAVHDHVARECVSERVNVRVLNSKLFGQLFNVFPERSIISIRAFFFKYLTALRFPPQIKKNLYKLINDWDFQLFASFVYFVKPCHSLCIQFYNNKNFSLLGINFQKLRNKWKKEID